METLRKTFGTLNESFKADRTEGEKFSNILFRRRLE